MTTRLDAPRSAIDLRANPRGLFGGFLDLSKKGATVEPMADQGLNRRALQWIDSCANASARLERFAFDASERVIVEISQSSRFAAAAKNALAPLVHYSALALSHAKAPDLAARLNRSFFRDGPRAYCDLSTPHGPGRVLLPALNQVEEIFQGASGSTWSEQTTREAFILHEIGHVEDGRREGVGSELLGARFLPPDAALCVELLAAPWSEPEAERSPEGSGGAPALPSARQRAASAFELVCLTIAQESYADCFSALALGGADALATRAYAREWSAARGARIDAHSARVDNELSDYEHDSREALAALCERLENDEGALSLDPASAHELCLSCAAEGLGRWMSSVAARAAPGPLMSGFYAKCAQLKSHPSLSSPLDFFELVDRAERGPLAPLVEPQNWAGARRLEIANANGASDDATARVALSIAITLAESLGAPRSPLTGALSPAAKPESAGSGAQAAGPCLALLRSLSARRGASKDRPLPKAHP